MDEQTRYSERTEGVDYELYRKERLDLGPRVEDIVHLSDLRALATRAREMEQQALLVEREITTVHVPPKEYFPRPGWDPHGRFTAAQPDLPNDT